VTTYPTIYPSNIQWVGLAKEVTYGTAIPAPTAWVPVGDPKHTPALTMLTDQALRGNMAAAQAQVAGTRADDLAYKTNLYLDTCAYHLDGILGYPDSVTGTADPYTHRFSLLDTGAGQPNSYTLFLFNGAECWQMSGGRVVSLDIDMKPDGLVELTPSWKGLPATKITTPTNTPSTTLPNPGWDTSITNAGVGTSVYSTAKVGLKREDANPVWTLSGSQTPYVVFTGALTVDLEMTAVYQGYTGTPTDLSNYLANTQPAVTIRSNPAGDAVHYLQLQMSKCGPQSANVSAQGGYMQVEAKFQGIQNTTDGLGSTVSPILATLLNSASTSY
jgi:hypothetical protein